jgi:FkbM family methyltransferase
MFIARMMNRFIRLLRCPFTRGMRLVCKRKGVSWDLDLDEGIDLSIYVLGAYEPGILRAYSSIIARGDVVFDIGANVGAHSLHFARLVGPTGRVVAIEPTDYAISKLRKNLSLNAELATRVSVRQHYLVAGGNLALPKAVAARWPVANVHADLDLKHLGKPEALDHASAITADEVLEAENLHKLDFVKIDVDGNEYPVLRGFRRSLERFRPRMLIELAPFVYDEPRSSDFDDYVCFLAELGYAFTEARTGRPLSSDPKVLRHHAPPGCTLNCLLYPAGKT